MSGITAGIVTLHIPDVSRFMGTVDLRNSPETDTRLADLEKYRNVMLRSALTSGELIAGGRCADATVMIKRKIGKIVNDCLISILFKK